MSGCDERIAVLQGLSKVGDGDGPIRIRRFWYVEQGLIKHTVAPGEFAKTVDGCQSQHSFLALPGESSVYMRDYSCFCERCVALVYEGCKSVGHRVIPKGVKKSMGLKAGTRRNRSQRDIESLEDVAPQVNLLEPTYSTHVDPRALLYVN